MYSALVKPSLRFRKTIIEFNCFITVVEVIFIYTFGIILIFNLVFIFAKSVTDHIRYYLRMIYLEVDGCKCCDSRRIRNIH